MPPHTQFAFIWVSLNQLYQRQCTYYFPEQFPNGPQAPNVGATNSAYDGWFVNITNLFFANGHRTYLLLLSSPRAWG